MHPPPPPPPFHPDPPQEFQSKELPNTRIQPDRRWFGNTRVIGQSQLEQVGEGSMDWLVTCW